MNRNKVLSFNFPSSDFVLNLDMDAKRHLRKYTMFSLYNMEMSLWLALRGAVEPNFYGQNVTDSSSASLLATSTSSSVDF